ncbi:hypothetical protein H0G86_010039 [Trichoderma simmonsii]|uniref:Uncharacterized protein n=1 Tax=Trichoderma simmonsii TaxID=1491479 RepID=A0A8G0PHT3_9HYPO|nr:hypothetical protein H0G86_010039 [Trichoderma simmonsii]
MKYYRETVIDVIARILPSPVASILRDTTEVQIHRNSSSTRCTLYLLPNKKRLGKKKKGQRVVKLGFSVRATEKGLVMWFPSSGLHGFLRPRVFGAAGRKILFPPTLLHSQSRCYH